MILRQTAAIFTDAYRELNAKKLFWITLLFSIIIVAAYACFSIDDRGVHFLWFTLPGTEEYAANISPATFFKVWMYAIGIGFWLTWVATILALISTAGIFPDLLASGSIDLYLSKPISRLRLFLTKFLTGLLFVAVQVGVFVVGCLLVIGIRANAWEWSLLLAIPIVLAFFSYLYAICTLFGILTRSTITALLLTLVAWFCFFGLNTVDEVLLQVRSDAQANIEYAQFRIADNEARAQRLQARIDNDTANERTESQLESVKRTLDSSHLDLERYQRTLDGVEPWYQRIFLTKTFFPKTGETVALLERYTIELDEIKAMLPPEQRDTGDLNLEELGYAQPGQATTASEVVPARIRIEMERRSRSLAWVLGTSFGFTGFILGIAAFIFSRRDY
ncbi:MAG: hypothetical protein EA380_04685 [Phycisphaeraceae bacterium]|nr:MAG: hypothetical protein EA380_04685 [Phycisphaeraceae bacterium]